MQIAQAQLSAGQRKPWKRPATGLQCAAPDQRCRSQGALQHTIAEAEGNGISLRAGEIGDSICSQEITGERGIYRKINQETIGIIAAKQPIRAAAAAQDILAIATIKRVTPNCAEQNIIPRFSAQQIA